MSETKCPMGQSSRKREGEIGGMKRKDADDLGAEQTGGEIGRDHVSGAAPNPFDCPANLPYSAVLSGAPSAPAAAAARTEEGIRFPLLVLLVMQRPAPLVRRKTC